jgi:hypothetical protein
MTDVIAARAFRWKGQTVMPGTRLALSSRDAAELIKKRLATRPGIMPIPSADTVHGDDLGHRLKETIAARVRALQAKRAARARLSSTGGAESV